MREIELQRCLRLQRGPPHAVTNARQTVFPAGMSDQGMAVWWGIGAGGHVEPHSHANERMLRGKMAFRSAANSGSAAIATSWSFG
jgi:hypothetical protein